MTYAPNLAAEIRAEMGRQKISVAELSRLSGLHRSLLHRRLGAESPLDTDELLAVAKALGLSVVELVARAQAAAIASAAS